MQTVTDPLTRVPDLAKACGVSKRTVYNWRKDDTMPGGTDGPWDAALVLPWAEARKRAGQVRGSPAAIPKRAPSENGEQLGEAIADNVDPTTLPPDTRYRLARAKREELTLERMRGELVERAQVEAMLVSRCQDLRRVLTGMGRRLATLTRGKPERQVREMIDDTVATALEQFVRRAGLLELLEEDPDR